VIETFLRRESSPATLEVWGWTSVRAVRNLAHVPRCPVLHSLWVFLSTSLRKLQPVAAMSGRHKEAYQICRSVQPIVQTSHILSAVSSCLLLLDPATCRIGAETRLKKTTTFRRKIHIPMSATKA
jgi:hypothetical protein